MNLSSRWAWNGTSICVDSITIFFLCSIVRVRSETLGGRASAAGACAGAAAGAVEELESAAEELEESAAACFQESGPCVESVALNFAEPNASAFVFVPWAVVARQISIWIMGPIIIMPVRNDNPFKITIKMKGELTVAGPTDLRNVAILGSSDQ